MTLQPIKYISADNLQMAEVLLKEHKGRSAVVAGGTDQMGLLKDAVHADPPQVLIGLKPAKDFSYVKTEADGVRIGALTTLNDIAKDPTNSENLSPASPGCCQCGFPPDPECSHNCRQSLPGTALLVLP